MSRTIELVATSDSVHHLIFGWNDSELATFSIQMWITHYHERAIDWLQSLSLGFMSFMGGNLYLHNSNEVDRCSLFGERQDCKVGFVVNEQAGVSKILDSLGIHTDGEWEVESVTIPPDLNYPDGMYSVVPKNMFYKREGVLYSEFLRNMKTSGSVATAIEAITGEPLRGKSAYVVLKNTSTEKVQLWAIEVNMTKSR